MDVAEMGVTLAKTLGLMLGVAALLGLGILAFIDVWAKKVTQDPEHGRIIGIFDDHGRIFSKMLRIDGGKAYMGRGDKKEEYLLDVNKQRLVQWPAGLPWIMQIPVRAHIYIRNQSDPLDLKNPSATLSARARMMISDEAMLKTTWRDAKESAMGGPLSAVRSGGSWGLILLFANLALTGFGVYMIMGASTGVKALQATFGAGG